MLKLFVAVIGPAIVLVLAVATEPSSILFAQSVEYEPLRAKAEEAYARKSYALVREAYEKAIELPLTPEEKRWVEFRLADTLWRAQAATETPDPSKYEIARAALDRMVRDITRVEDRDRLWAEVKESLADSWWLPRNFRDWNQAWTHYQQALDWWAGSSAIDEARTRYLSILFRASNPESLPVEPYWYGRYGNWIPLDILANASRIAVSPDDRSRIHYLVAVSLQQQTSDPRQWRRIPGEYEAALKAGKSAEWYDDALFQYASWMEHQGPVTIAKNGEVRQEPDYAAALILYRRLTSEFKKGETRHFDQAEHQIQILTRSRVDVSVFNAFLPGSEVHFNLNWRNAERTTLTLYRIDLTRNLKPGADSGLTEWTKNIDVRDLPRAGSWTKTLKAPKRHQPMYKEFTLDRKLPAGAYLLEAQAGEASSREIVLVSDTAILLKTGKGKALVYFADSADGKPKPNARVRLWERYHDGRKWRVVDRTGVTNEDGIVVLPTQTEFSSSEILVTAASGDRQAFANTSHYFSSPASQRDWRIYAFTDRAAYRPGETAKWKIHARMYDGKSYSTPAGQKLTLVINDPRGNKVKEETIPLNAFGGAWGELALTESMPLGLYHVSFIEAAGEKRHIGGAQLLRLEEYKLPEFKVTVKTPEAKGRKKTFQLGDTVEAEIQADYYFGGPVSGAAVEVVIRQRPFQHFWRPKRAYEWYYEDIDPISRTFWYGSDQVVKRETLTTDAKGAAKVTFDTPAVSTNEFEYTVEARVTDASRREITGSDSIRVTRQLYYAYPRPRHHLYKPDDRVTVEIQTIDANDEPVSTDGTIRITREKRIEVWVDPKGRRITGDELHRLRGRLAVFPPLVPGWRRIKAGYQSEEILSKKVKTDDRGQAELVFSPNKVGYYRIAWAGRDRAGNIVQGSSTIWAADRAARNLGYEAGRLEIVVDRDTLEPGQTAEVLLNAPAPNRYVLFSVEGDDIHSTRLVHMEGMNQWVSVPIEESHTPNIFLAASMLSGHGVHHDTKQIVVPPVRQFLNVTVKADRGEYQPRQDGVLTVTTLDHRNRPVSAEVALGLVDESVSYIQSDLAGDPRRFYFGTKRSLAVQTMSGLSYRPVRLEPPKEKRKEIAASSSRGRRPAGIAGKPAGYGVGGFGGGFAGDESSLATAARPSGRSDLYTAMDRVAAPGAPASLSLNAAMDKKMAAGSTAARELDSGGTAVQVRSDFRSTAFWQPDIVTGADGRATVKVTYPDSTTTWKATARAATRESRFGIASADTRTKQPLIVRLQAPRFFLTGDAWTVSAIINNNTDRPLDVRAALKADGVEVTGITTRNQVMVSSYIPEARVPANGETRVDWTVTAAKAGQAKLTVEARAANNGPSDAMERVYPVYEHGIEKLAAKSGKLRDASAEATLDLPPARKEGSTRMMVRLTSSMAASMLDALPYLIDYPYGCTEQTMSRFLPTVVTAKTLANLGVSRETVMNRLFGGIEPEFADKTQPKGKRNLEKMDAMIRDGLARLADFQHPDGGWGWWKDGESDHYMTAYVVWGLTLARDAGIAVDESVLDRGAQFLDAEIVEEEANLDLQAWMLHALAARHAQVRRSEPTPFQMKALENLYVNRERLNAYSRSLLALSAHDFGLTDRAKLLVENLANGVVIDDAPDTSRVMERRQAAEASAIGTAHWGTTENWWRWSDGAIESTAFALRAILAIDPENRLVEPAANWLIQNRRGAQWTNTRDTAYAVLALNDYLRRTGELGADVEVELRVNGKSVAAKRLTRDDALNTPMRFDIDPSNIRDGENAIEIRRVSGNGPVYFAAEARYFSLEEPIAPAGSGIFARRIYFRRVERPTLLKGVVSDNVPMKDGDTVKSGDRIECLMTIEAKNDYEYLVFEDLKPAGLEAVEIRSGSPIFARQLKSKAVDEKFGDGEKTPGTVEVKPQSTDESDYSMTRWVYQELRDRKAAFFLDKMPQGVWEIRYELRAETPGQFHALPVMGHAMYVPEIRCNGTETRITVRDR